MGAAEKLKNCGIKNVSCTFFFQKFSGLYIFQGGRGGGNHFMCFKFIMVLDILERFIYIDYRRILLKV